MLAAYLARTCPCDYISASYNRYLTCLAVPASEIAIFKIHIGRAKTNLRIYCICKKNKQGKCRATTKFPQCKAGHGYVNLCKKNQFVVLPAL
jgi:hypothetical protein